MKTALKWIGIVVGILLAVIVIAGFALNLLGNSNLASAPDVPVSTVAIPTDPDSIARGEHLYQAVSACAGCHGENLEGEVFIDGSPIGYVTAPNLTSGQGGIGAAASDDQLVRAIRHGVGYDDRTLVFMPSNHYAAMSDSDTGALVAYIRQAPPVNTDLKQRNITFPGTAIFGLLGFDSMPVNTIDHTAVGGEHPAEGKTVEYGEYLVNVGVCRECHAANLAGNVDPNGPPLGSNITPGGAPGSWNEAQFLSFMRSGVNPEGSQVSEEMPIENYRNMTDDEISAIWLYLESVPPLPDNE